MHQLQSIRVCILFHLGIMPIALLDCGREETIGRLVVERNVDFRRLAALYFDKAKRDEFRIRFILVRATGEDAWQKELRAAHLLVLPLSS